MKDILTIIFRLTLSCIIAATIMGFTFVFTSKAKQHNAHVKEEKVAYSLLGFKGGEKPDSVHMDTIYRYVVSRNGTQYIGYLMPLSAGTYTFVQIDLDGKIAEKTSLPLNEETAMEEKGRETAILGALKMNKDEAKALRFADQTRIISQNGKRTAYLISGTFPGFKTHITVMMALKPDFTIIGFEVMEQEEDPGLGAEIEQNYFKNQFKGKSFDTLKDLKVVKEPIPADYLDALELKISEEDQKAMMEKYKDHDIYALTGATISSTCVTNGIRGLVKKFAYRIEVLDSVIDTAHVAVAF